ncbi:MAG TPA: UDP-N-acetylmuramoyl-L-alanine--D-glutamate ligase [Candidatus Saccharimonadales bacterium]|jgi:UDP-N-acetylmuramoylalanine--D-glutamate ligase
MRVAIAGFGVEGRVNYDYWRVKGADVTIVDEREIGPFELPYSAEAFVGKGAFKKLKGFDMVVRTASLPPTSIKTDGTVWSATNEFFEKCPAQIIGVTGTKGKGTTCSLIASVLRAAGRTVHLVGNIGVPALSVLPEIKPDDVVVYELSSFQLWDLKKSPHIAVVLAIEPDHLDVHKNMKDYVDAKANIRRHQTADDICWYHPTNESARQVATVTKAGHAARYGIADDNGVYVKDGSFVHKDTAIGSVSALKVVGQHNIENTCAALSATINYTQDSEVINRGLGDFTGLPHLLKFVAEKRAVRFYDDSIATTPGSAIAAVRSFDQPKVVILGGKDKGSDYTELVAEFAATASIRAIVCIGSNGPKLAKQLMKADVKNVIMTKASTMSEIVDLAAGLAKPYDVVILSPAAASFDMFSSYSDRGDQFVACVEAM